MHPVSHPLQGDGHVDRCWRIRSNIIVTRIEVVVPLDIGCKSQFNVRHAESRYVENEFPLYVFCLTYFVCLSCIFEWEFGTDCGTYFPGVNQFVNGG